MVGEGGKPPREALLVNELEHNDDPLPGDGSLGRFGIAPVGWMGCNLGRKSPKSEAPES